jgi:hypothetical protein
LGAEATGGITARTDADGGSVVETGAPSEGASWGARWAGRGACNEAIKADVVVD